MSGSRRYTMHDVARLAGVSYQTVSRVINHHPYVAEDTRERVLQVIAELGYRPNRAAQSLAGHRSHTLAMTTFGIDNYGPSQMVINIEQAARQAGYDLIFASVTDTTIESMRVALDRLLHWEIDGLLFIMPVRGMPYDELVDLCGATPIVLVGAEPAENTPVVYIDQQHGATLVAEHLLAAGHRTVAEIRGPENWVDAQARHEAIVRALNGAGLALTASAEGDWTSRSGYEAALSLLNRGAKFSALFAANDQMALGAIRALIERELRVPEDVSVVGFDDMSEAAYFTPPLTTVRQDFATLGRRGIEYLVQRINNPRTSVEPQAILPQFMPRASTMLVGR
jgi:DNA-binding LacI/PurR family transcriptional regulator